MQVRAAAGLTQTTRLERTETTWRERQYALPLPVSPKRLDLRELKLYAHLVAADAVEVSPKRLDLRELKLVFSILHNRRVRGLTQTTRLERTETRCDLRCGDGVGSCLTQTTRLERTETSISRCPGNQTQVSPKRLDLRELKQKNSAWLAMTMTCLTQTTRLERTETARIGQLRRCRPVSPKRLDLRELKQHGYCRAANLGESHPNDST